MSLPPESRRLLEALVAAYPRYVVSRLSHPPDGLDPALEEGRRWLGARLTELLSLPFSEQARGPLEVFQEAMIFPTRLLAEAGVATPRRDPVTAAALPGDVYDLAPASSRDLGEEVWRIHLLWGATKARAVAGGDAGVG